MSYMGNDAFWNEKFGQREKMLGPDQELVNHRASLGQGEALDIACGDGRNTMYLLSEGFQVTSIDFSQVGLNRLKKYASEYRDQLLTHCVDLEDDHALDSLDMYDLIVINHYRLKPHQMAKIPYILKQHGVLYVSGFSELHPPDDKVKEEDLIIPSDFDGMTGMKLLNKKVFNDSRGNFVTYLYKKLS